MRHRGVYLLTTICILLGLSIVVSPQIAESTPSSDLKRFGFELIARKGTIDDYDVGMLNAGWYHDLQTSVTPSRPGGMEYVQTIWVSGTSYHPDLATIGEAVDNNPGSIWAIGNEPDSPWQGNCLPEEYAAVYNELYTFIKSRDPDARIAIGAVIQPTPLRLQYLDMIVEAYQEQYGEMIPVDVWNIHNMILREERGSWGANIPPGIDVNQGQLYRIRDNDNLDIFKQHIVDFRKWMAQNGQRDKPLMISEYGVLMPELYGFTPERVRDFMYQTFDFMLTATDPDLGYPADDNRLVQRWAWYSLNDEPYDAESGGGFNGNLFDPATQEATVFGVDYGTYTRGLLPPPAGHLPQTHNLYLPFVGK